MTEERHSFIIPGVISREAFQDMAVQQTSLPENEDLHWYLHAHNHSETTCNERCQVVHKGIIATNVTQMDVAKVPGTP